MLRWRKVLQYAIALFATLFLTGFVEGLLLPTSTASALSVQGIASSAISLILCTLVFIHLAFYQADRTLEHALLALIGEFGLGLTMLQATPSWLQDFNTSDVIVEVLVLSTALVVGTSLGSKLRRGHAARAEA